ncbi:hypothetical protein Hanom_Chr06g00524821 [Helianthus anomalus]
MQRFTFHPWQSIKNILIINRLIVNRQTRTNRFAFSFIVSKRIVKNRIVINI